MDMEIPSDNSQEITTIKLSKGTKSRLDRLKDHKRETYEDILQNLLNLLNVCRVNPEKARAKLLALDRMQRGAKKGTYQKSN